MDVYNKGFNPDITAVDVEMNSDTMEVKWSVTINKSEDGNAWTGLYSRGGGAISQPGKYPDSISTTSGHASIENSKTSNYILKRGTPDKMVPVNIFVHNPKKGCRVKQIFYKYTLKEYPTLEEKVEEPTKVDDTKTDLPTEPRRKDFDGAPYYKTMLDNPDYQ
jgi:hypothetical protein